MDSPENSIPVVHDKKDNGKKKTKMGIIIVAIVAVLIVAIIITVAAVRKKNKSDDFGESLSAEIPGDEHIDSDADFEPVTLSDDVQVSFDGVSSDYADEFEAHQLETAITTAYKPETTKVSGQGNSPAAQTTKKEQITAKQYLESTTVKSETATKEDSDVLKLINSFFSGKYYFDGTMISDGEQTPMEIAMNGSDFQMFSEIEGMDIAIMNLNSKTYLMNPDNKKYTEINSAVKKMMGIEDDAFNFEFNKIKFDSNSPTSIVEASYMNKTAVCYTYKDSEHCMEFITVGNKIKQITLYGSDGEAKTVLRADEFSSEIPDDLLNFKGYSKTNMISFMKDFM